MFFLPLLAYDRHTYESNYQWIAIIFCNNCDSHKAGKDTVFCGNVWGAPAHYVWLRAAHKNGIWNKLKFFTFTSCNIAYFMLL